MATNDNHGALPSLSASSNGTVLGAPESKSKSKTNVGKLGALVIVLTGFLLAIAGLLIYQRYRHKVAAQAQPATTMMPVKPEYATQNAAVDNASIEQVKADLKKKERQEQEDAERQKAAQEAQDRAQVLAAQSHQAPSVPGNAPAGSPRAQGDPPPPTPAERKRMGAVLVDIGGDQEISGPGVHSGQQQAQAQPASDEGLSGGHGQQGETSIAGRLQPTVLQARHAGRLPNLDFLLKRGMTIPCALQTGIDTTLPGFVTCTTLTDIYSANGKTLLLERGSTVFGEQQSSLRQGQASAFVLWTRIDTPSGVFANIDSPASDQMGYSGVPGYLDTHFWTRFGGAIMLSVIDDFAQAAAQRAGNAGHGSTNVTIATNPYQNTMQAGQEMAAEALKSTINIPPTLIVNPGTVIHVMVARDVSFEHVFTLIE